MGNIFKYIAIILMLGLFSCKEKNVQTQPDSNAALELYCRYADNEHLTVAYIGDFSLDGNKIDALMIQADNDDEWIRLKSEFGMITGDRKVVSVGIGIDTDFFKELGLDTVTDISQVDEERFNKMKEIIAGEIGGIVTGFPMPDKVDSANDDYLNIIANDIATALLNEMIKNGSDFDNEDDINFVNANDYGHNGYVSAADADNRTIWLFFYDSMEEYAHIVSHIKEEFLIQ